MFLESAVLMFFGDEGQNFCNFSSFPMCTNVGSFSYTKTMHKQLPFLCLNLLHIIAISCFRIHRTLIHLFLIPIIDANFRGEEEMA